MSLFHIRRLGLLASRDDAHLAANRDRTCDHCEDVQNRNGGLYFRKHDFPPTSSIYTYIYPHIKRSFLTSMD